jgi:carboxyl-terminal processing protease
MNFKIKAALLGFFALLCISFAVIKTRQQQLQQQLDLFSEFYTLLDKNYVDTLNLPDLMKRSMRKTLGELDPYSNYYDVEETKNRSNDWKGILYAGIGSTVKQSDSGVVIVEPTEGLAAAKAGLRAGDLILEINHQNVQHLVLDSVIKRLKGHEGDSLELTLQRPFRGILHKSFARENIVSRAVPLYFLQGDSIGYIIFSHFLSGSAKALKNAVVDLKSKGMKKLVLDMRGNNGGLVDECALALSIFFPPNTLVCSLRLKDSTANYSYKTSETPVDTALPLIILTDRHTISSGEIFAGCMKDFKRATLIGDRTYGKGFVQSTRFFKDGQSLYVTVARYYTPAGNFIGAKGVDPDIHYATADTLPPHLQAVINSGIITEYSIQYRNKRPDNEPFNNDIDFNNFKAFYLSKLSGITLPEENTIKELDVYPSSKSLKLEIKARKQALLTVYRKEIETELRKEILKRYYQFTRAGQLNYEQSGMYSYLRAHNYAW